MNSIWIRSVLPLMVALNLVACTQGGKSGGGGGQGHYHHNQNPTGDVTKETGNLPPNLPDANDSKTKVGDSNGGPLLGGDGDSHPTLGSDGEKPSDQLGTAPPNIKGEAGDDETAPAKHKTSRKRQGADSSSDDQTTFSISGRYTGAGDDYLRSYLTKKLDAVQDQGTRQRNQIEAQRIREVRTLMDRETSIVQVNVTRNVGGRLRETILRGHMNALGIATLSSKKSADIRGSLICLDRSETTCFTSRIRLEIGQPGDRGVVNIIHRRTMANFDWKLPDQPSSNPEFHKLVRLFLNTELKNGDANSLRAVLIDTIEVINARSMIKFALVSNENELISAVGPLLRPEDSDELTNVDLSPDQNQDDVQDLDQSERGFRTSIADSISNISLLGNDGHRRFTVGISVRGSMNGEDESVQVSFVRQSRGIKSLAELHELEDTEQILLKKM